MHVYEGEQTASRAMRSSLRPFQFSFLSEQEARNHGVADATKVLLRYASPGPVVFIR